MKMEYNIGAELQGTLEDVIKDREVGKESYEKQYNVLSKEVEQSTMMISGALVYLISLVVLLILGVAQKEFGIIREEFLNGRSVVILMVTVLMLIVMRVMIDLLKNKAIRRKYLEEYSTLGKGLYFTAEEEDNAETLKSTLDENNTLLELYKLVYSQQKEDVEVYRVDAPIIPSGNIPRGLTLHENRLFKEGETCYQVASNGKAYLKIYVEDDPESMVIKGNNIKQTVNI